MAVRTGMGKLYQRLRYLALTDRDEQPGDLVALDLRLRDGRGRYVSVPLHEATQRQVQQGDARRHHLSHSARRFRVASPPPAQ